MKIETRVRQVTIPQEVYISCDGKEFENRSECLEHECKIKDVLKTYWDTYIMKFEVEPLTLGYCYDSEDYYDYIISPQTNMDIEVLNNLIKCYGNVYSEKDFTDDDIGKRFVAVLEYSDNIIEAGDVYFFDYDNLWNTLEATHNKILKMF